MHSFTKALIRPFTHRNNVLTMRMLTLFLHKVAIFQKDRPQEFFYFIPRENTTQSI